MKQEWIEDFLALVEFGTFSKASLHRSITQPAFSRRIQALEEWLGVELIDRSRQPIRLTLLAQRYIPEFRALSNDINKLRERIQMEQKGSVRLTFITQHSLTITQLPALLQRIGSGPRQNIDFVVHSENRDECVTLFIRGQAHLLLHLEESHELLLDLLPKTQRIFLGHEKIIPISAPDHNGEALFNPDKLKRIKTLSYPRQSFMGRATRLPIEHAMRTHNLEIVYESIFLAGVKEMVKAGLGIAWLPTSLVQNDIETGDLINLSPAFLTTTTEINLYRHLNGPNSLELDEIFELLRPACKPQDL